MLLTFGFATIPRASAAEARRVISLDGEWQFRREGSNRWKQVQVPSAFQSHEGIDFHGIGWYRKRLEGVKMAPGMRVLLRFQASATETEVWLDGQRLGSHLGGWTPFRFDITELLRASSSTQTHEVQVRVDEKVGHNTQGFLPIIAPHFGGLWQEVSLEVVPETYIDDLRLLAFGDGQKGQLELEAPLIGSRAVQATNLTVRARLLGKRQWTEWAGRGQQGEGLLNVTVPVVGARIWSPTQPNIYEVEVELPWEGGDVVRTRAAFRSFETAGGGFRLNGQPLSIRGLLNWGYSPPKVEPNPGEAAWRKELEFARAHGFNLMKFCLWVPPQRYLELADEYGMLTWMEYPTWHPDLTPKFLAPLRREFTEFFDYDRNHPSVILRSLTCETGPSADLNVIRSLYNTAHERIPQAVVEDDSSWIEWNRVADFYDDHPYGNNHTWVKTLHGFRDFIAAHGEKPLMLGESIAADTWLDYRTALKKHGTERPWWAPGSMDAGEKWMKEMRVLAGEPAVTALRRDSLRYGLLMRKYQIETFRREIPQGGYVVSVIRDIPNAEMGLLDYFGQPKWSPREWNWQRDNICLLKTENDRRAFASGGDFHAELLLGRGAGFSALSGRLEASLVIRGTHESTLWRTNGSLSLAGSERLMPLAGISITLPPSSRPVPMELRVKLTIDAGVFENHWPLWLVPSPASDALRGVSIHHSVEPALAQELFPGCPAMGPGPSPGIVVASQFDDALVSYLENGGQVLFIPDGRAHSLALEDHWFLRGAPLISDQLAVPHDFLLELQDFDLASTVIPNLPQIESCVPLLTLWDTHDLKTVKTHGIIFETKAGKGTLLVTAARHTGEHNAAGRWLLAALLERLRSGAVPSRGLSPEVWDYLKARLNEDQTNLVARPWQFKPDPEGAGLTNGWQLASAEMSDWKEIKIGDWWERQGYPELDGWAWYRLWVDIPERWRGRKVYLSFEGVDDMYELYVNGEFAGKSGDLATRKDALGERKSYDLTERVEPGGKALIAVRVYDWFGYGGIYRPVTLGTVPFRPGADFLK